MQCLHLKGDRLRPERRLCQGQKSVKLGLKPQAVSLLEPLKQGIRLPSGMNMCCGGGDGDEFTLFPCELLAETPPVIKIDWQDRNTQKFGICTSEGNE